MASSTRATTVPNKFGPLLAGWRRKRGLSQLALASDSLVSQRHISFMESGRAAPSRDMVLRLASVLDIPLAQTNVLLASAGFSAAYAATPLHAGDLGDVKQAIDALLTGVEPMPAYVVNSQWQLLLANEGALRFFGWLLGEAKLGQLVGGPAPLNVMHLLCDPQGLRPHICGWSDFAAKMLLRLERDAALHESQGPVHRLLQELNGYPDMPAWQTDMNWQETLPPALVMSIAKAGEPLSTPLNFHVAITTIGTPYDITLEDLRLETFFPADEATRAALLELRDTIR